MISVLIMIEMAVTSLPQMRPDTPPPLPIPVEHLSSLKSRADIINATRLADGSAAPSELVLPQLMNRLQVIAHIRANYPNHLRLVMPVPMPWAWVFIDQTGVPRDAFLLKTSGILALDSLALAALRMARFEPAQVAGKMVGVWTPMPTEMTYRNYIARSLPPPDPNQPYFTPFTVKPELQNRDEVAATLAKAYPPALRAAGVGDTVLVWIFVDENGRTINTKLRQTSGHEELDSAALIVARSMRWSPALNRDAAVRAWIQAPIVFNPKR